MSILQNLRKLFWEFIYRRAFEQPFEQGITDTSEMNTRKPRDTLNTCAAATAGQVTGRYHGLKNQGATCYLNSVLQVLFMTKDFREAVTSRESKDSQETVAYELKRLFEALNERPADTERISSELDIKNVYQQQDAAEYLEKILSKHDDAPQFFEGRLKYSYICSNDHETFARRESFWTLPLSMDKNPHSCRGNYSVTDMVDMFLKPASIGGDKMYCDNCKARAEATIACEMEHLPEILTLHLKRFEVDDRRTLVKNCCSVEVPHTLQIKISDQKDVYNLYATVDHSGSIRSGHYTAKIKSDEDQKWYCFDDTNVTPITQPPATSQSAYLIMYKRSDLAQELSSFGSCEGADRQNGQNDGVTKEDEEKKRREEDHMLREEEMRRREEEFMQREGELRRREEVHMWTENSTRRREVEGMRRDEERMRKEEALKRREKAIAIREEELMRRENQLKKREDNKGTEELKKRKEKEEMLIDNKKKQIKGRLEKK